MQQLLNQRPRLARPFPPRQPLPGHHGRVRVRHRAATEDDIVPGRRVFSTRDELVQSGFPNTQAESLSRVFPAGSALAKVLEAMERNQEQRDKLQDQRYKTLQQRLDILSLAVGLLVLLLLFQNKGIPGVLKTAIKSLFRL